VSQETPGRRLPGRVSFLILIRPPSHPVQHTQEGFSRSRQVHHNLGEGHRGSFLVERSHESTGVHVIWPNQPLHLRSFPHKKSITIICCEEGGRRATLLRIELLMRASYDLGLRSLAYTLHPMFLAAGMANGPTPANMSPAKNAPPWVSWTAFEKREMGRSTHK